jgi:tight adherence protein C
LPDALDLLVICAEAGLTVDAAFNRVARELGKAYPSWATNSR